MTTTPRCSLYLLYWYKSANTDAEHLLVVDDYNTEVLTLLALLVQKYQY